MKREKHFEGDSVYLDARKNVAKDIGIENLWEIADQFGLYSGIQLIANKLAVYEILKQTLEVPGHLVEFGSWKGGNLLFIAKVLNILQPNTLKEVYCFEGFEGLQTFHEKDKVNQADYKGKYKGNEDILRAMISLYKMENWVTIVKGNALETIDIFERENSEMIFSFAYIDFDLYLPVKRALDFLQTRMARGGIIVFDEANTNLWKGEGAALAEFLEVNRDYRMKTIEFARQPTLYIIRE